MTDTMPGLTVYAITMAQAREIPGPQQHLDHHRANLWSNVEIIRAAREHPGLFGAVVRLKRVQRRWSQRDLALETGYFQQRISLLESGKLSASDAFGPQLINVLGITLADLQPAEVFDEAA